MSRLARIEPLDKLRASSVEVSFRLACHALAVVRNRMLSFEQCHPEQVCPEFGEGSKGVIASGMKQSIEGIYERNICPPLEERREGTYFDNALSFQRIPESTKETSAVRKEVYCLSLSLSDRNLLKTG